MSGESASRVPADRWAVAILAPHYDAVRDVFSSFEVAPGQKLSRLRQTGMLVDPSVSDSERHFAGCRDDGRQIIIAPGAADLPVPTLVAIIAHEFGHAADFAYPANWTFTSRGEPALWDSAAFELDGRAFKFGDEEVKGSSARRRLWADRHPDQVEWAADAIVQAVTGRSVGYCGRCMLQCFSGGKPRPAGLR